MNSYFNNNIFNTEYKPVSVVYEKINRNNIQTKLEMVKSINDVSFGLANQFYSNNFVDWALCVSASLILAHGITDRLLPSVDRIVVPYK